MKEASVFFSLEDLFPTMTEEEYIHSMEDDSPFKSIVDQVIYNFLELAGDKNKIKEILNGLGYRDIEIFDLTADLSGAEVALPFVDITYKSESEIDENSFKRAIQNEVLSASSKE